MVNLTVFEGIDGAGKSIVSKNVAERLGAIYMESPSDEFQNIRKHINANTPTYGQFLFYLGTNYDLSNKLSKMDEDVICARYCYSTFVDYSIKLGLPMDEMIDMYTKSEDLIVPDRTILLTVNSKEQKRRINYRNQGINTHTDDLCLNDSIYREEVKTRYIDAANKNNWHVIDTSYLNIDQVVSKSIEIITKND